MIRLLAISLLTLSCTVGVQEPVETAPHPRANRMAMEGASRATATTTDGYATVEDGEPISSAAPDSLNDGPHVYWQTDSTAVVFYLCDEYLRVRDFPARSVLRFHGMCDDSRTEYVLERRAPEPGPEVMSDVPRIFAVSDIHGEYEAFVELLQNAGIIDRLLHWKWSTGHLVVLGDVTDRGDMVTETLWLIHRLEKEAELAGGRVHYILGNHEIMVMQGDVRYVNPKYTRGIVAWSGITYEDLFGPDMELGRWLRSLNTAIRLNNILFVHAGIGSETVDREMSITELNVEARIGIDLRSYEIAFSDIPNFVYRSAGPFWYRGYYREQPGWYPQASPQELERILEFYGAEAVVVGHTEIDQVLGFYGGRFFGIDVPYERLGTLQGLLWEDGTFYRITGDGERESPMYVGRQQSGRE